MNSSYLCTDVVPKYYTITLTLLASISFPINCLGVWLVWFHSPQMGKFKYCLMYLQNISNKLVPIHQCYIGELVTAHNTLVIFASLFCFELPALLNCFKYRHDAALGISNSKNAQRYTNLLALFVAHLLPPFAAGTLQLSLLTYNQKYDLLKTKYPQCIHFVDDRLFAIYDWNLNPWIAICGIGSLTIVLVVVSYSFGLVIHTMQVLHKLRVHMSAETFKMHKNALISLSMQCVIPSVFIFVPVYTILIIVLNNMTELQELSNCSFFGFTSHSCISTIVMIITNARYSTTIKNKIRLILHLGRSSSMPVVFPLSINVQNQRISQFH